jgi:hypothetical protein
MSPLAILTKLAAMLRIVQRCSWYLLNLRRCYAATKGAANRSSPSLSAKLPASPETRFQHSAVLKPSSKHAIAVPETNDQSEREKLIRRRWSETGVKMWNPGVHGTGQATLNIQGRVELLPVKPGETLPGYDKLEFKIVRSYVNGQAVNRIVCEGVVVDPPMRRK